MTTYHTRFIIQYTQCRKINPVTKTEILKTYQVVPMEMLGYRATKQMTKLSSYHGYQWCLPSLWVLNKVCPLFKWEILDDFRFTHGGNTISPQFSSYFYWVWWSKCHPLSSYLCWIWRLKSCRLWHRSESANGRPSSAAGALEIDVSIWVAAVV